MKVHVYHLDGKRFDEEDRIDDLRDGHNKDDEAMKAAKHLFTETNSYNLAAIVDIKDESDLDQAYRLTNNIDQYWWKDGRVDAKIINARFTSIGDILQTDNGKLYLVRLFGFLEIKESE